MPESRVCVFFCGLCSLNVETTLDEGGPWIQGCNGLCRSMRNFNADKQRQKFDQG